MIARRHLLLFGVNIAPTITSAAPAAPAYGVAYSHTYTATGSPAPTWSVTAGALPTGLSLDSGTGVLSGTPTASGAFSWTVTATNAAGTDDQAATATVTYLSKVLFYTPTAYWKLDETGGTNAADSSGNGRNGVYSGVTLNTTASPTGSPAGTWDGINDYVNVYSAGLAAAFPIDEGAISVWVKASGAGVWTDGAARLMCNFETSGGASQWVLEKPAASNTIDAFRVPPLKAVGVTLSTTAWWHFAMTWSVSGDALKVYVNGTQIGTTQTGLTAGNRVFLSARMVLGANSTTNLFWSGNIAHMAVFPAPLTAAQILALATP